MSTSKTELARILNIDPDDARAEETLPPDELEIAAPCPHPSTRLFTWFDFAGRLWGGCCACGEIIIPGARI